MEVLWKLHFSSILKENFLNSNKAECWLVWSLQMLPLQRVAGADLVGEPAATYVMRLHAECNRRVWPVTFPVFPST